MKDNEKLYKVYHRNYQTIEELFDDLSDAVLNIGLENNKIIIHYNSDILEIELCHGGFRTYVNGQREKGVWEDQDIYFYAIEFVHEQEKGLTELEIYDTSIVDINNNGITYADEFGRRHLVDYADCAVNGPTKSCVAERNVTKWQFKFYNSGTTIKISFKSPIVFKKGNHLLIGGKAKRFRTLEQAIIESGYTTFDLS